MARAAPFLEAGWCNRSATARRFSAMLLRSVGAFVILQWVTVSAASAQPAPAKPTDEAQGSRGTSFVEFLGGAALGLVAHEAGHLVLDVAFDAEPGFKRVSFAGVPFAAITHRSDVTPRQEFAISSAGFWVQHATSEMILTSRPDLRHRRSPVLKGWLAWNVIASVAYSTAAFGRFGPEERDTRGMAASLGVPEPCIGAMLLGPAVLDGWRYWHPQARWARWASRVSKIGLVVVTAAAHR
jgi:hypothetical protein